jgi:hypothetical protein
MRHCRVVSARHLACLPNITYLSLVAASWLESSEVIVVDSPPEAEKVFRISEPGENVGANDWVLAIATEQAVVRGVCWEIVWCAGRIVGFDVRR